MHRLYERVPTYWRRVTLLVFGAVLWSLIALSGKTRSQASGTTLVTSHDQADPIATSDNPRTLLSEANRLAWLFNWPEAELLYIRAEEFSVKDGDKKSEVRAHIGRIVSASGRIPDRDISDLLKQELNDPIVQGDSEIRLWCLGFKGYADVSLDAATAQKDWLEALSVAKSLGNRQWQTRLEGELGVIAFLDGDAHGAADLIGKALLKSMTVGDVGTEVRDLTMIGHGFIEVRRYGEAIAFFNRAISLSDKTAYAGFPFGAIEGKSSALLEEGDLQNARDLLDRALGVAERSRQVKDRAEILLRMGDCAAHAGNLNQAIKQWKAAIDLALKYDRPFVVARAGFTLAKSYVTLGDLKSADEAASRAIESSRRTGNAYYLPRDLTMLADLKALRGLDAQANDLYWQAEDRIEEMLNSLPEPYWKSSLASAMGDTYVHHFELSARAAKVDEAFHIIERVRGRTVAAALESKPASLTPGETGDERNIEEKLSQIQLNLGQTLDSGQREILEQQIIEYERRLSLVEKPVNVMFQPRASLQEVQRILRPDEAVLEYVLDEPFSYCLSISRDEAIVEKLSAGRTEIERLTRSYLERLRARDGGTEELGAELERILLKPIRLAHSTRLVVVPDAVLNLLPFEVLYDDGHPIVESKIVSYVPASTVLYLVRTRTELLTPPRTLLAVGDVVYENQGNVADHIDKPRGIEDRLLRGLTDLLGTPLHDLPRTRDEVIDVGNIVGHHPLLLLGSQATETAVKSQRLSDFAILHFAVHGFADTEFPERSGLVLGTYSGSKDDGLLQAREILQLRLNADLVALSACDTGIGKIDGEAGVNSLAGAFLAAGSRTVMATLWNAQDSYSRILMQHFYTHLKANEDKALALRNAKLDLLRDAHDAIPVYYWAPFVLVGDGGSPVRMDLQ